MIRRLVAATVACVATVVVTAPVLPPTRGASAQPRNRAAVIVDTGQEVKRVCVRFDEESLSGAEILRRAGVDPVFASYGSNGEAVCALCGVGCPSDSCFCDRSRYWAYARAEDGRTRFTTSQVGSSSTRVGNGDVEGWRWGTGTPPPFESVEVVCGEVAASSAGAGAGATSTTTSTVPGSATPPPPPAPAARTSPSIGSPVPTTTPATGEVEGEAAEPTGEAPVEEGAAPVAAPPADPAARPAPRPEPDEPGSSGPAVVVLIAALAGLGGWWAALRRRRRG